MANKFDDLSKGLASTHSRRGIFKVLGAGAVGAVAAAFMRPAAGTDAASCSKVCKGYSGSEYTACLSACLCENGNGIVCGYGPYRACCKKPRKRRISPASQAPIEICMETNSTFNSACVPIPDYSAAPI